MSQALEPATTDPAVRRSAFDGELAGRRVVVTGGGSGIGAACARRFAAAGAEVVVADIDLAAAESVAKPIQAEAIQVDLGRADFDAAAIAGNADLLVNNAGLQH